MPQCDNNIQCWCVILILTLTTCSTWQWQWQPPCHTTFTCCCPHPLVLCSRCISGTTYNIFIFYKVQGNWSLKRAVATSRVYHGYTPGYWRLIHTCTHDDGSLPMPWIWVWSRVPSLVPIPIPMAGIPMGYKQGGSAEGEGYTLVKTGYGWVVSEMIRY